MHGRGSSGSLDCGSKWAHKAAAHCERPAQHQEYLFKFTEMSDTLCYSGLPSPIIIM